MNDDFRITPSALALSLSDKAEHREDHIATHSRKTKSAHARIFACIVSIACLLVLAALSTPQLFAQIASGGVTGTVKDAAGAVISDATVTLANTETGVKQTANTTATGTYNFTVVPYGNYTLLVQHPGFKDVAITGFHVHVQVVVTEDATMPTGSAQQKVTVTASTPLLQAQDATIGTTIEHQQIVDLPLLNRHFDTLTQIAAGATTANVNFGGSTNSDYFNVNGMNPWMQDFRLDGIDNNVEQFGGPGPLNDNLQITPPPDAIQEFRLQTGDFPAEFGHSSAAIINAVIKSGTNQVHGDLWEFLQNTAANAIPYFQTTPNNFHYNEFGGTVGGPVWIPKLYNGRNRTFFFFDYQGARVISPRQYNDNVPTALEQSSNFTNFQDINTADGSKTKTDALGRIFPYGTVLDPATTRAVAAGATDPVSGLQNTTTSTVYARDPFFTGGSVAGITNFTPYASQLNQIPAGRLDPNAIKLLQLYPTPTGPGIVNNYIIFPKQTNNTNQYDVRIDEDWHEHDTLFAVYDWSHNLQNVPNALPGIANGGSYSTGTIDIPVYTIALGETHVFTPTLSNDFHAGYNHLIARQIPYEANTMGIPAQFGIGGVPQVPNNGGLPSIQTGLTQLGPSNYYPNVSTVTSLELMENVTKIYNNHTFKGGAQWDRFYANLFSPPYGRGNFSYSGQWSDVVNANTSQFGPVDMLLNPTAATYPNAGGISNLGGMSGFQFSNAVPVRVARHYFGAFFQDDWKVTPTLTLNLGLRYDFFPPYYDTQGFQGNFVQSGSGNGFTGTTGPFAGANGPVGTYYVPKKGCSVPRAPQFDALLTTSGVTLDCTGNFATGLAQKKNFAPRIGFAKRVKDNFVVRGAFGIAYGALSNIGAGGDLMYNYPFAFQFAYNSQNAYTPFLGPAGQVPTLENALTQVNTQSAVSVTNPVGLSFNSRQFNYQTPYTETYNLFTQYTFTAHDSLEVGYVGVVGRHLDGFATGNAPTQILPNGTNIYNYIPFPNFAPNSFMELTNGKSSYNSMQATYQHATSYGLTMNANYTLSQCMTDQTFYVNTIQSYRALWLPGFGANGDYAICDTDSTHVIHVSGDYALPVGRGAKFLTNMNRVEDAAIGGWALNGIFTFQSGEPISVGCPVPTTADFGCYADRVQGVDLYGNGGHTKKQWLNPNAFAEPPAATSIGQSDYSPLGGSPLIGRGPTYTNLDASLFKSFSLVKNTKLQFRAEAFNALNHPQFGQPVNTSNFNTDQGSSYNSANPNQFSSLTYTRNNSRQMQFALKLLF
ncbi:MAG: carboxypeptidase-like regulatory domain-containing protein [Acidobacteriaceae bacterium]